MIMKWLISLLLAVIILLYGLACAHNRNDSSLEHEHGERPLRTMPECPEVWDDIPLFDSRDTTYEVPGGQLRLPGPTTNIPEFHDCQRFLLPDTTTAAPGDFRYDSLYAIFASSRIANILDSARSLAQAQNPEHAVAAALVYTFGPGYRALGIGPNFSCLYLYDTPTDSIGAIMVRVGLEEAQCAGAINPNVVQGTHLLVKVVRDTGFSPTDYPNTARWDWDPEGARQFIGLDCGDAWCEVGDSSFRPLPAYPLAATPSTADAVVGVKGWFDEQYLAEMTPELRPGLVKATIIPSPTLRDEQFAFGAWTPVAYVALDGPSAYYKTKFNFNPVGVTTDLTTLNRAEICYGTRRGCGVPTPSAAEPLTRYCGWLDRLSWLPWWPQRMWWTKIVTAGGSGPVMYRCVTRRTHPSGDMGSPGTVRWRFLGDDETSWIDCREGCCETNPS